MILFGFHLQLWRFFKTNVGAFLTLDMIYKQNHINIFLKDKGGVSGWIPSSPLGSCARPC